MAARVASQQASQDYLNKVYEIVGGASNYQMGKMITETINYSIILSFEIPLSLSATTIVGANIDLRAMVITEATLLRVGTSLRPLMWICHDSVPSVLKYAFITFI